ncbi:phosphoadenosine phosphosulfate reductase domain-containing protein [Blautia sp. Sow4_E7]|uniref:phosphoadenosine phosphosulfate reductase domain-containing protein n=1 Tax=Blautia sp. Sow4_E7 TaxID=3438749 RepID=UPI003F8D9805
MGNVFDICKELPSQAGTIVDNMIIANGKINSPIYKNIVCSISGGADSDIVLDICTKLDKEMKITYVWFDTGLEYDATKEHLKYLEEKYRIKILKLKAIRPIPWTCKNIGQPFISKQVSLFAGRLQKYGFQWEDKPFHILYKEYPKCKAALRWWCNEWGEGSHFNISRNKFLKEFMIQHHPEEIGLEISERCCHYAKKDVAKRMIKEIGCDLNITGVRKYEGGARATAYKSCFSENSICDEYRPIFFYKENDKIIYNKAFNIENSDCYSVYGLKRTGCAGCPFGRDFEMELKIMEMYEPKLFRAVNIIFEKSYQYTRMYKKFRNEMEES